jgi:diacylglycerol O-acyltransferase / wax synthase
MALTHFEPLSHLDASFLALERPSTHMHVAGVAIFAAGPLRLPHGGIDIEAIRGHILGKLQYVPRYRQRLAFVPVSRTPVWVDDEHFNFDYHVRHTSLPHPGNDAQLKRLAGRVVSQQLDRNRPLWELWVVEGMDGDRFALVAKIHHCMIDGISGVDLTTILLNVMPTSVIEPAADWQPRPVPTSTELMVATTAHGARRAVDTFTSLPDVAARSREMVRSLAGRAAAAANSLGSGWLTAATRTPLNPDIGPSRRFDWTEIPLSEMKAVRRALGGSINDLVLATVAGAVRRFLTDIRSTSVNGIEFRVMNPVSTRKADQKGALGNQVAMWLVNLPLAETDPVERLRVIQKETTHLREKNHALGASTLVELSRGTPLTLIALANRVLGPYIRPFNMTVTNVPGPQFPMYLLEAPMLANYPIVPLWSQHGVAVALFSYNGVLNWGVHADYDAVADTDAFVESIHYSFEELATAAGRT